MKIYLMPIERIGGERGPKYFCWRDGQTGCIPEYSMMDYGFFDYALLVAPNISQADHDVLILNADVFPFPDNLDTPVNQDVQPFFEAVWLPVDWMTPATTWLELLRMVAGMMQFNQRYAGIYAERYGGLHSVFDNATLSTRLRQMTAQEQEIFLASVASFGFDPGIVNTNSQLRLLVRRAGTYWQGIPFHLGGITF